MKSKVSPRDVRARIRCKMEQYDLTVGRAAKACNMPVPTFETYLYGNSLPGAYALLNLSQGLHCSVDWLLSGSEANG